MVYHIRLGKEEEKEGEVIEGGVVDCKRQPFWNVSGRRMEGANGRGGSDVFFPKKTTSRLARRLRDLERRGRQWVFAPVDQVKEWTSIMITKARVDLAARIGRRL